MAAFDDALFLWDPAIGEAKSHDLVLDVDPSNATDGDTGTDGDGDFRTYDAVGKFARFTNRVSGESTGDVTYMVAVKVPTSGTNWPFGHSDTTNDLRYELFEIAGGTPGEGVMQLREGGSPIQSRDAMPALGSFAVLVGTVDRPGEGINLYIDGTEVGPVATTSTPPVNVLTVGRLDRPTPLASNDVQIYAAAFWNRLLPDAEIAEVTSDPQAYLASPPSAPTNPAATAQSSTVIRVTWDDVTDETGYRVERSPDGSGSWTDVSGNLAADTVLYDDTGLTASTQYFYRVFAFNADGDSSPSSTVNATTSAASGGGNRMGGDRAIRRSPRTPR